MPKTVPLQSIFLLFLALPIRAQDNRMYFEDWTARSGLAFEHHTGATGELLFPEITGSGAALLDYDGDGDLDVYLVQSSTAQPSLPLQGGQDRLYRNDFQPGDRPSDLEPAFTLVDVTMAAGLEALDYGIGVAVGDYDADGFEDIYVTNYGPNRLWRNRGDGTFEDVTQRAGLPHQEREWSSSAAFLDYDQDGHLDLFVANYVDADIDPPPRCYTATSERDYCGPLAFDPTPDRLYRNLGDGTFVDRSIEAGIASKRAAGLGVIELDVNGDQQLDILVANDQTENHLWLNRGDGTFSEEALWWGFALDREGKPQASMGIAPADWDNDGDEDVVLTHLVGESNTLYSNETDTLEDVSRAIGMRRGSFSSTGFGVAWLDVDHDGWLDLFVVNGEVKRIEAQAKTGDDRPFGQPDQLFLNQKGERLELVDHESLPHPNSLKTGRGLAVGDLNLDGSLDLLISNNEAPAMIWLASLRTSERPLAVDGPPGSLVRLEVSGRSTLRRSHKSGSFASSRDESVRFWPQELSVSRINIARNGSSLRILKPPAGRNLVVRGF